ncbi:hypothetical protein QE152_g9072 [Popillia japonica]|uniref:Uncharacterized protein n=1 Tax=Popillia japonica TaxID=7064 RepID=A0AAW1LZZ2_POPJA
MVKNASYDRIFKRISNKALFGVNFQTGLFSSNLPNDVVAIVTTEGELENVLDRKPQQSSNLSENRKPQQSSNLSENLYNIIEVMKDGDISNLIDKQHFGETDHKVLIDVIQN